jgi:acylphosphatase
MEKQIPVDTAAHITVRGMVQGVGFRYFVYHHARQLGVRGWVRNLANGDVELEVEGHKSVIEDLLGRLRRGPRSAVVSEVQWEWRESRSQFQDFEITDS